MTAREAGWCTANQRHARTRSLSHACATTRADKRAMSASLDAWHCHSEPDGVTLSVTNSVRKSAPASRATATPMLPSPMSPDRGLTVIFCDLLR
jgi:hypothetical protein